MRVWDLGHPGRSGLHSGRRSAIGEAQTQRPECDGNEPPIVLALMLPDLHGMEVLRAARLNPGEARDGVK
jgi:CheY-like chemotaxis protein